MKSAYEIVGIFEEKVAEFCGAKHGVATDTCSSAIFLCCKLLGVGRVTIPARTYISVPAHVIHAGGSVEFADVPWTGEYQLAPYPIWDSALRFRRGSYAGGFRCLSFQAKKILPIGRGGMILTDDSVAASTLRKMRSNGRNFEVRQEDDLIASLGWDMAMTPEQGARGLQLLESADPNEPDQSFAYPDLRTMPVFA